MFSPDSVMAVSSVLLICYSPVLVDGKSIIVCSHCGPVKAVNFEPAGHSFHKTALKLSGFYEEEGVEGDNETGSSDEKPQGGFMPSEFYSNKRKKKSGSEQDHYALIGLAHLRFLATEEQIRKSYREMALKYHPDKQAAILLAEVSEEAKEAKKEEIETHFKSIQEAYGVLTDPVKKRIYDSTDEFDDEIPTDCAPQDFYKVFGPVFMRNARWSVNKPIPLIGEETTPMAEVDAFYNFWYGFKSWREFPHADEYDIEDADSRDHKRWMERQNAKLGEKARKEEYARIRTLVDNAYKKDPRIQMRKDELKAEKQRRKDAKRMAKKLEEEEAQRIAEEEKCRKEEENKKAAQAALVQKRLKEKEKKLLRKERTRLRTLASPVVSKKLANVTENDIETICMSFDIDRLRTLCSEAEKKEGVDRAEVLEDAIRSHNKSNKSSEDLGLKLNGGGSYGNSEVKKHMEDPLSSYAKKEEKPWSKEEIEMLRKGMNKYLKGTSRRWEVISEYIGTGRTIEEILKATKTVLLKKPDSSKAFDSFLEKRKPGPSISSPLTSRLESEGVSIDGGSAAASSSSSENSSERNPAQNEGPTTNADPDAWSLMEERALVQALKTFPKETNQRWERVAASVPNKTMNQCKKKFTLMKESFRKKKNAA